MIPGVNVNAKKLQVIFIDRRCVIFLYFKQLENAARTLKEAIVISRQFHQR